MMASQKKKEGEGKTEKNWSPNQLATSHQVPSPIPVYQTNGGGQEREKEVLK
jgi:hypothetical protein